MTLPSHEYDMRLGFLSNELLFFFYQDLTPVSSHQVTLSEALKKYKKNEKSDSIHYICL